MRSKNGFTLIEVMLFLALSGALVASLIAGTSRSISQKRYTDTVDNFVDYLQGLYSDVNYVQGTNGTSGGRSNKAIYGKLVISNDGETFTEYTVTGKAVCDSVQPDARNALNSCDPEIVEDSSNSYKLSWGGKAQAVDNNQNNVKIAILIINHPKYGTKNTYVAMNNEDYSSNNIDIGIFKLDAINFCISSDDESAAGYSNTNHKLIRIDKESHNASGVEIISDNDRGDYCH